MLAISFQGRAALMASPQSQGDHMLVHLVQIHTHTHTRAHSTSNCFLPSDTRLSSDLSPSLHSLPSDTHRDAA